MLVQTKLPHNLSPNSDDIVVSDTHLLQSTLLCDGKRIVIYRQTGLIGGQRLRCVCVFVPPSLSLARWRCVDLALPCALLSVCLLSGLSDLRSILHGGVPSLLSRIFSCRWSPPGWLLEEYLKVCKGKDALRSCLHVLYSISEKLLWGFNIHKHSLQCF